MVVCLERGEDLRMAQLMPLPLTVSCFSKIQIGVTFLVPAHLGSPGKRAVKRVCVACLILTLTPLLTYLLGTMPAHDNTYSLVCSRSKDTVEMMRPERGSMENFSSAPVSYVSTIL